MLRLVTPAARTTPDFVLRVSLLRSTVRSQHRICCMDYRRSFSLPFCAFRGLFCVCCDAFITFYACPDRFTFVLPFVDLPPCRSRCSFPLVAAFTTFCVLAFVYVLRFFHTLPRSVTLPRLPFAFTRFAGCTFSVCLRSFPGCPFFFCYRRSRRCCRCRVCTLRSAVYLNTAVISAFDFAFPARVTVTVRSPPVTFVHPALLMPLFSVYRFSFLFRVAGAVPISGYVVLPFVTFAFTVRSLRCHRYVSRLPAMPPFYVTVAVLPFCVGAFLVGWAFTVFTFGCVRSPPAGLDVAALVRCAFAVGCCSSFSVVCCGACVCCLDLLRSSAVLPFPCVLRCSTPICSAFCHVAVRVPRLLIFRSCRSGCLSPGWLLT